MGRVGMLLFRAVMLHGLDLLLHGAWVCYFVDLSRDGRAAVSEKRRFEQLVGLRPAVVSHARHWTHYGLSARGNRCGDDWLSVLAPDHILGVLNFYMAAAAVLAALLVLDERRAAAVLRVVVCWTLVAASVLASTAGAFTWARVLSSRLHLLAWLARAVAALVSATLYASLACRRDAGVRASPFVKYLLMFSFFGPAWLSFDYDASSLQAPLASVVSYAPVFVFELVYLIRTAIPATGAAALHFARHAAESVQVVGIDGFFLLHWTRLEFNNLLQIFWFSKFTPVVVYHCWLFARNSLVRVTEETLLRSCETSVSVAGTSSVVSLVGRVGTLVLKWLLETGDIDDGDLQSGSFIGILFLILAMQTGLTSLRDGNRLNKLYRNLWLLTMAWFHLMHQAMDTVLVRLTTGIRSRWPHHLRVLTVAVLMNCLPVFCIYRHLAAERFWDPWIMPISLYASEVLVKTFASFVVYGLLLWDARVGALARVDDAVYYVRGGGAVFLLFCSFAMLINGLWLMFVEQTSLIRSTMIGLHAYANVWMQAREGWQSLRRRWQCDERLARLADATADGAHADDVCSICYQPLAAAALKSTACAHLFHVDCLRRWLHVQERCPLCQANVLTGVRRPSQQL